MCAGIQEEALRAMLEGGAVCERARRKMGVSIRLGGSASRWLPGAPTA
jgi:hypothetical protein